MEAGTDQRDPEAWARACARVEERRRARERVELQIGRVQDLRMKARELRRELEWENRDLERLRGPSLHALVRTLVGDRQRELEAKERGAHEVQLALQDAWVELELRQAEMRELEAAWEALADADEERRALFQRREQELRAASGPIGEELCELQRREAELVSQQAEVQDARLSGHDASEVLDEAVSELSGAAAWGTWVFGSWLLVTWAKHRRIDAARVLFAEVGEALRDFESRLRGVPSFDVPEIELEPLHVGLDYFLGGFVVDVFVQGRIKRARRSAESTRDRVEAALTALNERHAALEEQLDEIRDRRRALVEPTI